MRTKTLKKKIEINTADLEELTSTTTLSIIQAKKILQLRDNGHYVDSYDDLREMLNLKEYQVMEIKI